MKKTISLITTMFVWSILIAPESNVLNAQVVGIGARSVGDGSPSKSLLLLNREPIPYLELKKELVEILPGGINVLATASQPDPARLSARSRFMVFGMRAGSNSLHGLRLNQDDYVYIGTRLLQLDDNGIELQVDVMDNAKNLIASRKLHLMNYQEALIELATAANSNRRLAVRLLPTIKVVEPLQDYPALVQNFGTLRGILIRNSNEILSRGGCMGTVEDLNGTRQQFNTLETSNSGLLVISYRPFPGAVIAGYFLDNELNFEWNGDLYEWISFDKPFLPEGRWAAYVWQAGPSGTQGVSFGGFESDPGDIRSMLDKRKNALNRIGGIKK